MRTFFFSSTLSIKPGSKLLAHHHRRAGDKYMYENMCGEHGGCVRYVISENRFATVAHGPLVSFAASKTVSPLAMWRMVSATPEI